MGGCFHVYIIVISSLYNIWSHIYIISRFSSLQARLWLISYFAFVLFASFVVRTIHCVRLSLCHSVSQKIICLHLSLCYSVSKKSTVSICHCVILSQNDHLSPFVIVLFCLKKNHLSPFVIMLFCLKKIICLYLSLCHSVFKKTFVSICHYVILSQKNHLSSFVIMSFCLKNFLCLRPSLCYSVSKTSSVFICPYVTLSPIYSVCIVLKSLDKDVH